MRTSLKIATGNRNGKRHMFADPNWAAHKLMFLSGKLILLLVLLWLSIERDCYSMEQQSILLILFIQHVIKHKNQRRVPAHSRLATVTSASVGWQRPVKLKKRIVYLLCYHIIFYTIDLNKSLKWSLSRGERRVPVDERPSTRKDVDFLHSR